MSHPPRTILIARGSDLVHSLGQLGLIDEYRPLVHPVSVGRGKRLFRDGSVKQTLKLQEARTLSTGVVVLSYQMLKE